MNVRLVHSAKTEPTVSEKSKMIETLTRLLQDTCSLRNQGAPYAKLAHAQGYADGYMRVLVDGGYLDNHELLEIIRDVRRGVDGPATRTLVPDDTASDARAISA